MKRLFIELRRRRVFRTAALQIVGAWLVLRVADVVFPALDLTGWTLKLVIVLGLLGFPIALALSWLFEITPQGIVSDALADSRVAESKLVCSRRPLDLLNESRYCRSTPPPERLPDRLHTAS